MDVGGGVAMYALEVVVVQRQSEMLLHVTRKTCCTADTKCSFVNANRKRMDFDFDGEWGWQTAHEIALHYTSSAQPAQI